MLFIFTLFFISILFLQTDEFKKETVKFGMKSGFLFFPNVQEDTF